jgi:hypothetical protein
VRGGLDNLEAKSDAVHGRSGDLEGLVVEGERREPVCQGDTPSWSALLR